MTTIGRLEQYYPFDPEITENVSRAAGFQNPLSFSELADKYNLSDGPERVTPTGQRFPIEVATITPVGDYDETSARILHLPMANPLSRSNMVRAMRLYESDPTQRLIVYGNQSGFAKPGTLSFRDSWQMLRAHDLTPAALPILSHLADKKIKSTEQLGYSYGADKAASVSAKASEFDIDVERGVYIEPAGIVKRSLRQLGGDFMRSNAELQRYWRQADCPPLAEAREDDTMYTFIRWSIGLTRLSSVAIASCLSRSGFELQVREAMGSPSTDTPKVTIGWGENSEITPADAVESVADALIADYGAQRVQKMELRGMHHAGADDIDLHAAMMLQGLRASS